MKPLKPTNHTAQHYVEMLFNSVTDCVNTTVVWGHRLIKYDHIISKKQRCEPKLLNYNHEILNIKVKQNRAALLEWNPQHELIAGTVKQALTTTVQGPNSLFLWFSYPNYVFVKHNHLLLHF